MNCVKKYNLKIGVCAHCFGSYKSGIGRYAWEIFLVLHDNFPNATFFLYSNKTIELPIKSDRIVLRQSADPISKRMPVYFWLKFISPLYIFQDKLDFIWSPVTLTPLFYAKKSITTVHDLNHMLVKETMPWINALFFKFWFKSDVKKALSRVCNSQGTAVRMKQLYDFDSHEIVRPAVSENLINIGNKQHKAVELATNKKFILAVSTIEPRKNLLSLVKAYAELQQEGHVADIDLVLVGKKGWKNKQLEAFIADSFKNTIHFTGFVDDETLANYYKQASIFVMPSFYEGFGMPVAEALASGTPVLCSDTPELRESGQNLCTYVPPTTAGIKNGIKFMLHDEGNDQHKKFEPIRWYTEGIKMVELIKNLSR